MNIYQYLLTLITKIEELAIHDISQINGSSENSDVLFFTENALNSILITMGKFTEIILNHNSTAYDLFKNSTLNSLLLVIGLMLSIMIGSWVLILLLRKMFKEVYESFLSLNEGDFEERT